MRADLRLGDESDNPIDADVQVDEQQLEHDVDLNAECNDRGNAKLERNLNADLDKELVIDKHQFKSQ